MKKILRKHIMKYIPILIVFGLLMACNNVQKKEAENVSDSKSEFLEHEKAETIQLPTDNYSTLLIDYECDMSLEEIAKFLKVPLADLEMPSNINNDKKCVVRYSRNGTYESNLTWGNVPASKQGNKKAITKALKDKEGNVSILGSDIIIAETGDSYLLRTPINGRISIRNANYDSAFQLFYGSKGKRTEEQHEEMKVKITELANYLLKKHRK